MPRAPILSREGLYRKLSDGTIVPIDWNLVNTSLGVMLEQRQVLAQTTPVGEIDAKDAGFTRMVEFNEDQLQYRFSTGGQALPTGYGA